jgi:GNAT superfamily N-acetyltransferase
LPSTSVRLLTPDDWSIFREVRLAALLDAPYAFGSTYDREVEAAEESWRARLAGRAQFVAELDGKVVGTAGGVREDDENAQLVSMWVAPQARGKGAGDGLMKAVDDWAREGGFETLVLWVTEGNRRAEALYARWGFTRTGVTKPVRHDSSRMEYQMRRSLRDSPG